MEKTFKKDFLSDQVAIVTGGATGICYGISLSLLKFGCTVVIMSRKEKNITEAVKSLEKESNNSKIFGTT